jgi:hypothetical protein
MSRQGYLQGKRFDGPVKVGPKAGFVYDMPDADYHGSKDSLSSTFARLLTNHVPAKAIERFRNRKPTKAMNLGKAAHAHALGAGPELVVWQYDGRTKDGKAERAARAFDLETEAAVAVTEDERAQIEGMATAIRADPVVSRLLDECLPEVSAFWQEGGVWCRARYDMLGEFEADDYKTAQDVSARGFSKAMASYGYHQQADFYLRGLRALDHPAADKPLRFVCQETEAPYLVQIHQPDEMAMEIARVLNDRAIRIYAACMESGDWPGYADLEAAPASLPAYYWFDIEEALPDELRLPREEITI